MSYQPRPNTVVYRVIDFLQRNAGEMLSRTDIAQKFDCAPASVDVLMGDAQRAGYIERGRDDEGVYVWKLGRSRITLMPADALGVASTTPAARAQASEPEPDIDLDVIKVRKGVRLKSPKEQREETFDRFFETFEVGDSAEFDASWMPHMRQHAKRFQKANEGHRFYFADTGPGRSGVERRA